METGNHRIVLFNDFLVIVGCDGPKWKIIEEKELADKTIGAVIYRPYHRIWGGGSLRKVQAEYILCKLDGYAQYASTITVLRIAKPGRQHKSALKGFLSLLRQMK